MQLNANISGAAIFYTLDCSVPSKTNGMVYSGPILIDSTTVVKAVAVNGDSVSAVITNTFLFISDLAKQPARPAGFPVTWGGAEVIAADYEMDPEVVNSPEYASLIDSAFRSLPALALSMPVDEWFNPATGLYVGYPNSDVTREKPVTAEFIFNTPEQNFAVECGVQNQGGTSIVKWKIPKQSMRLLFKGEYGPTKLDYKLFPDSEIKSINTLVVDGLLYSWLHPFDDKQRKTSLYFRDQLASDMQNRMGGLSFHGRYVNLFINGLYWGIYDLHERPDDAFLAEYLDAEREDFDIIKHNPQTVVAGSNDFYLEMLEVARRGLAPTSQLQQMKKYLDIPAFIDYMILNFYLGNFDWAHQNYYAARNKTAGTGFRFYTWDAEHVMRYSDVNYNNLDKNDKGGPTELHTLLSANIEYRMMFADAVYRHFYGNGALTPENLEKQFIYRKNEIDLAIILESARWGDYREDIAGVTYTKDDFWVPEVNKVLKDYIPRRRDIVISQMRAAIPRLFPTVMPPETRINGVSQQQRIIELLNPNSKPGAIYYTLDGSDPRNEGGSVRGMKYSGPVAVSGSSLLKARFLADNSNEWSALAELPVILNDVYGKKVVINEIMYHPEDGFPEFIELFNTGDETVSLTGMKFTDGIDFTFEKGLLNPQQGIVLTNDTALFRHVYHFNAFGQYEKKLNNGGELVILQNLLNQVIDSVNYTDTIPWPILPGGKGYSIEVVSPLADNAIAGNWKVSPEKNGTPYKIEKEAETNAAIYPNPFTEKVVIDTNEPDFPFAGYTVEIFSQIGQKIKVIRVQSYNSKIEINPGSLPPGIYFFRIIPDQNFKLPVLHAKAVRL